MDMQEAAQKVLEALTGIKYRLTRDGTLDLVVFRIAQLIVELTKK